MLNIKEPEHLFGTALRSCCLNLTEELQMVKTSLKERSNFNEIVAFRTKDLNAEGPENHTQRLNHLLEILSFSRPKELKLTCF